MFRRLVDFVHDNASFLFMAQYSIVWMYYNLFIDLLMDFGIASALQSLSIMLTCMLMYLLEYLFLFFGGGVFLTLKFLGPNSIFKLKKYFLGAVEMV